MYRYDIWTRYLMRTVLFYSRSSQSIEFTYYTKSCIYVLLVYTYVVIYKLCLYLHVWIYKSTAHWFHCHSVFIRHVPDIFYDGNTKINVLRKLYISSYVFLFYLRWINQKRNWANCWLINNQVRHSRPTVNVYGVLSHTCLFCTELNEKIMLYRLSCR